MDEKRKEERFARNIKSEVHSQDGLTFSTSADLSQGGMFISTPEPLKEGAEISLRMYIPGNEEPVDIKGRVRWIREDDDESRKSGMGIEFIGMSPEEMDLLKKNF